MHHSSPSNHARHDLALIAGHAAGDLSDSDRPLADALLAGCSACVDLRRDLVAIAAATRALPAPLALGRDLRLDPAQAARLRRGSWLRGVLRPFAAGGNAVRPMAAAFTSLGLAGLLVATVIPGIFGSAAAPGAPGGAFEAARTSEAPLAGATSAAQAQESPAQAHGSPGRLAPAAAEPSSAAAEDMSSGGVTATGGDRNTTRTAIPVAVRGNATPERNGDGNETTGALQAAPPAFNPLIAGSLGLLALGLLLFGLRIAGRRLR